MKIFYLTPRFPYPIDKGDKLRAFHQIRLLSEKHEIVLLSIYEDYINEKDIAELKKFCSKVYTIKLSKTDLIKNLLLGIFSKLPFQVHYFLSKKIKTEVIKILKFEKPDILYSQLIRTSEYLKDVKYPKILDYIDTLSIGLKNRFYNDKIILKPFIKMELNRVLKYENLISNYFNKKIIISARDKTNLPIQNKDDIWVLPNGIDLGYFDNDRFINTKKDYDIIFTGNLSYKPNIQAVNHLINNILPILKTKKQNIKIALVGASPTKTILKLQNDNVIVTGWVDDIREYYAKSKIFVAPMFMGSGMQNKILEAMAMKLPCITSDLVVEGLNAENNKNILTADSNEEYADKIIELLTNKEKYSYFSNAGYEFVSNNYNWKKIGNSLNQVVCEVLENAKKN